MTLTQLKAAVDAAVAKEPSASTIDVFLVASIDTFFDEDVGYLKIKLDRAEMVRCNGTRFELRA